ncbi:MAG: FtsQ-type POTRA domain-containing protein [Actinomycetota bacterium]|nr:FtsQ-type POTRA domain-containing protein [Actinomycetota bacterium]
MKPGLEASLSSALTIAFCVAVIAAGLAAAYFAWFRDSSFVLVEKVTVEGMEGPEAETVTAALTRTGSKMTTLNIDDGELAAAVSRYPTVVSVDSEADFPHGLTVKVVPRPPVLNATDGGPPVPVAADGTLLRGVDGAGLAVPTLDVAELPAAGKLTGEPLEIAQVAGASPDPLRALIEDISQGDSGMIEVTLEGDIPVIFGDAGQAEDKWAAIAAILADPEVKTLTDLDVRVPERPSIGGAAPVQKGK